MRKSLIALFLALSVVAGSDAFASRARLTVLGTGEGGTLLDGTEFDASYNRGQPLTLGVSQVIRGWTEGLQLMSIGSKYKFWIPYELAYGTMGQGQIPGGAMLIFEVELLDVKKKQ